MKQILSTKNPLIKQIIKLEQKSSLRRKSQRFVVEGQREIFLALQANYQFEKILFAPQIFDIDELKKVFTLPPGVELIQISLEVYQKIAYRKTTEGIIGIAKWKDHSLENLKLSDKPLILIAENVEKPGNIGAMLRTADAANLDAFIVANPVTDIYNPNIIRSSLGALFTVQVATAYTTEIIQFLQKNNITLFAATLQDSQPYFEQDFTQPSAIAVGSEAYGLTGQMREAAFRNILIPMEGKIDSLNVSVSAAILIFEAKRQRKTLRK